MKNEDENQQSEEHQEEEYGYTLDGVPMKGPAPMSEDEQEQMYAELAIEEWKEAGRPMPEDDNKPVADPKDLPF